MEKRLANPGSACRRITAVTAKEQRALATAIKRARELALLPYVAG